MRINILACGADGWKKAPFDDPDAGEFWVVNDNVLQPIPKIDLVIDVHDLKAVIKGKQKIRRPPEVVKACIKKIKKKGWPCYSVKEVKDVPNIKPYPYYEIIKEFDSDYFASGPDYALALAIYKGATEIHTYGVLMMCGDEYYQQKPSFEHWLGVAKGRGIKTVIHDHESLASMCKTPTGLTYGFNLPQRWLKSLKDNPNKYVDYYS